MAGADIELGRPPLIGPENLAFKGDGGSEFLAQGEGIIGRPSIGQNHFKPYARLTFKVGKKSGESRCLVVDRYDNRQLRSRVSG